MCASVVVRSVARSCVSTTTPSVQYLERRAILRAPRADHDEERLALAIIELHDVGPRAVGVAEFATGHLTEVRLHRELMDEAGFQYANAILASPVRGDRDGGQ